MIPLLIGLNCKALEVKCQDYFTFTYEVPKTIGDLLERGYQQPYRPLIAEEMILFDYWKQADTKSLLYQRSLNLLLSSIRPGLILLASKTLSPSEKSSDVALENLVQHGYLIALNLKSVRNWTPYAGNNFWGYFKKDIEREMYRHYVKYKSSYDISSAMLKRYMHGAIKSLIRSKQNSDTYASPDYYPTFSAVEQLLRSDRFKGNIKSNVGSETLMAVYDQILAKDIELDKKITTLGSKSGRTSFRIDQFESEGKSVDDLVEESQIIDKFLVLSKHMHLLPVAEGWDKNKITELRRVILWNIYKNSGDYQLGYIVKQVKFEETRVSKEKKIVFAELVNFFHGNGLIYDHIMQQNKRQEY